jgi:hypothetical protein
MAGILPYRKVDFCEFCPPNCLFLCVGWLFEYKIARYKYEHSQ